MVPAAMCRKAMVAALRAVVVAGFITMLACAPAARADEPVPLGQTAPSDLQPAAAGTADASTLDGASGGDAPAQDPSTDGSAWSDWFDPSGTDWWSSDSWSSDWEWLSGDGSADPSADAAPPDATPPADQAPPADEAPLADQAPASDPATTDTVLADALTATTTDVLAALTLTVSGTTLSWPAVSGVGSYVFVRKVPNQTPQYSIVYGTSITPPAVPGETVDYSVRTNVSGSSWAPEVAITYPDPTTDPTTAPTMSVSGTTVNWTSIAGVGSYVFVRKVPDQTAQYSVVYGTSITPPAVAGQTVSYGVRTNVSGSTWAREVSITYPSSTPSPTPSPTPQPIDGGFQMGVAAGSALSYELSFAKALGAHTARLAYGIGTSASSMASVIDAYAKAGVRPLLLATFYGRNPTTAEAQNLASWAATYGPGGSFWVGKSYPANTAVTDIELGNETSYSYQFSDNSLSTYSSRAQTYALRARDAANAIRAANSRVGLLAQGDNAVNGTAWVLNMLRAVPNLGDLVAGWTIHPYGPSWATRIDSTITSAAAAGSRALPIWITEWGLSTDNGRCLSDNYGYNRCMTYSEAASTLHSALGGMLSRYGSRLGAFFLYQAHDQAATGAQTGREYYFGALQSNANAKGAYTTEAKGDLAAN